jgi:hypothetical protein
MALTTLPPVERSDVQAEIVLLLQDLPIDSLLMLREFGRFLRSQTILPFATWGGNLAVPPLTRNEQTKKHLWNGVSADEVLKLTHLLPKGYEGDALEDTESISNDV